MRVAFFVIATSLLQMACAQAQPSRDSLPGEEILPGSPRSESGFFKPFEARGRIMLVKKGGAESVFRHFEKRMDFHEWEGRRLIRQVLSYSDQDRRPTGTHSTLYEPETLAVVRWQYDDHKAKSSFAFLMDGTQLMGTNDPSAPLTSWRKVDLGIRLFQNETRELFFRSLELPKGSVVKFPVIGKQRPFHGWISYVYDHDEEIEFDGQMRQARIWQATGNSGTHYAVIDQAPYVIRRVVDTGRESHVFRYETVDR